MSGDLQICEVTEDVKNVVGKFRFRKDKTNAAVLLKIDPSNMSIILDEQFEDITIEDLVEELPDQHPVYIILSYVFKHDDGRVSYPLIFIYVSPPGCKPELQMMYAGSKNNLVKEIGATKVREVRSKEEITDEWLQEQFFR